MLKDRMGVVFGCHLRLGLTGADMPKEMGFIFPGLNEVENMLY